MKPDIHDLTNGSIAKKLYRFALPIILINLLQAVYSVVDMIIVGQFTGASGMVAVSQGGQIVMIIFCIISAFSNAEAALAGRLFSKQDKQGLTGLAHNMLFFSFIMAAVIIVIVFLFADQMLGAIDVPREAFAETKQYLLIYVCGTFFVYIYNDLYGLLRGVGESSAPMVFALISTVVNLLLDYIFVGVFSRGAAGAAVATVISQAVSMVLIVLFVRKKEIILFALKELKLRKEWQRPLVKIGLPQAMQFGLTNLSFILISALINSFGVYAAAAAGATNKICTFAVLPGQAVMAALITFTAQNLHRQSYKRIIRGLFYGIGLAVGIALICLVVCELFPLQLMGWFTTDTDVIDAGIGYFRICVISFVVESVMFCCFGVLTGAGYTNITMCCALLSAFGFRYAFAWFLSKGTALQFHGIAVAYVIAPCVSLTVASLFLLSGRWKKPRVQV